MDQFTDPFLIVLFECAPLALFSFYHFSFVRSIVEACQPATDSHSALDKARSKAPFLDFNRDHSEYMHHIALQPSHNPPQGQLIAYL